MKRKIKNRIGEIYTTKQGYNLKIINYKSSTNIDILFEDNIPMYNLNYNQIKKGTVLHPFHPTVFNKGYLGIGDSITWLDNKHTKVYNVWSRMLQRCYDIKYHEKYPTYKDCYVCDEWLNFQEFSKWFFSNYIENYVLDKDILTKNCKVYSPQTCCFVPEEINVLFTNRKLHRGEYPIGVIKCKSSNSFIAQLSINSFRLRKSFKTISEAFLFYKENKESRIKELANYWKDKITKDTYNAMINYKVDIDD